jgi:hypothetical protein
MLPKALKFFESVKRFHDLKFAFLEHKRPNESGWTFGMFTQVSLAYAFYLAKSGQEQKARRYISDWMARNSTAYREETIARVSDLFEDAARSPYVLH